MAEGEKILRINIEEEMKSAYIDYSMSVIVSRALPDVRDGLKPVHRRVALKLIKWGMDTEQVVARFESERQALALMDHPNVARVFDAGATEQGRPFFAMEFVKGVPITEFCDSHQLQLGDRLALFGMLALVVGTLAGYLPARRAAGLEAVEALK